MLEVMGPSWSVKVMKEFEDQWEFWRSRASHVWRSWGALRVMGNFEDHRGLWRSWGTAEVMECGGHGELRRSWGTAEVMGNLEGHETLWRP